jgi:hypothetical protein
MLMPFDEHDQEALRILGFAITVSPLGGELAVLKGKMKIYIKRSGDDRLSLAIRLPGGGEIAAIIPREILRVVLLLLYVIGGVPADGRGPRATSGQGRAYSATRDDNPDRPALSESANIWRARCAIPKPRQRQLRLHSKTAGPSNCPYRLIPPARKVAPGESLAESSRLDLPKWTQSPRAWRNDH